MLCPGFFLEAALEPKDFFEPFHCDAWEAIHALEHRGREVDVVTLADEMRNGGFGDRSAELVALIDYATERGAAQHHVDIVRRDSARRKLMLLAADMLSLVRNETDIDGLIAAMRDGLDSIVTSGKDEVVTIGSLVPIVLAGLDDRRMKPQEFSIQTGLIALDRLIGGMRPEQLIVVAARPGMGKSSLMRAWCLHSAIHDRVPNLVFSLEVSKLELTEQFMSAHAHVANERIVRGDLVKDEVSLLDASAPELMEAPLYVHDRITTTARICAVARKWRALHREAPIVHIAVDYAGLVTPDADERTRELEVSKIAFAFKKLASDLHCPVTLITQLNREIEKRGPDAEPRMSDLRESGALEQHAHKIIFPHRAQPLNESGDAQIIVVKNRGGGTGSVPARWLAPYMHFVNAAGARDVAGEPAELPRSWHDRDE
jgi:replicative DNA helicase